MSEALWGAVGAIVGGVLTGAAAIGAQVWAARSQANVAHEAYLQQDRVWHRDQRLEAHHAFLNEVNRLVHEIGAIDHAAPGTPGAAARMADVEEALKRTVDAFNRVELVSSKEVYDLAVKILSAADPQQMTNRANYPAVMQAIGVASRNYREAAKAELKA